eukprot:TRINITY_DN88988_c0_g1_i1.p1 TRINITY_DN88988_c0_g1~~TRINITY_DN88988_c0_g1_i1.p1  ORF type:complete len:646 (+),score=80.27 TRINITY_DN88988_c0_g1_i1:46-1938(+)
MSSKCVSMIVLSSLLVPALLALNTDVLDADDQCSGAVGQCAVRALQLHSAKIGHEEDAPAAERWSSNTSSASKTLRHQAASHLVDGCDPGFISDYRTTEDHACDEDPKLEGCQADGIHMACRSCGTPKSGTGPVFEACPNAYVNVPVYHLAKNSSWFGMGVFMEAKLGTPGNGSQYVTLLLDSGSVSLAVIGEGTKGKPGALPQCSPQEFHLFLNRSHCALGSYSPNLSSSKELWPLPGSKLCAEEVNVSNNTSACLTRVCYAGGCNENGSGYFALGMKEEFTIGPYTATVPIDAVAYMMGPFQEPPSSGIIGLAGNKLNCIDANDTDTCAPTAIDLFLRSQNLENRLGMCLGRPPQHDSRGYLKHGRPGVLSLGGADPELYTGPLLSTGLGDSGFFTAELKGLGIGGVSAWKNSTTVLVDSGNPGGISMPMELLMPFSDLADNKSCNHDSECAVNIQLQGVCLNVIGLLKCNATAHVCNVGEDGGFGIEPDLVMLGYQVIKDLYLELDRENVKMGFAARSDAPCSTECSAVLTEATCGFTEGCSWNGEKCTGGRSIGSGSRGSTVGEEDSCFVAELQRPVSPSSKPGLSQIYAQSTDRSPVFNRFHAGRRSPIASVSTGQLDFLADTIL